MSDRELVQRTASSRGIDTDSGANPVGHKNNRRFLKPQWLLSAAVLVVGSGLSIGALSFLKTLEHRHAHAEFERAARDHIATISERLESYTLIVESLASYLTASDDLTVEGESVLRREFREFTSPLLARLRHCQALGWAPRVPNERRGPYEAIVRQEGFTNFTITERQNQGHRVPAGVRQEYFPVHFAEPLGGNEAALGFDLASTPARAEAIRCCRRTGRVTATGRLVLVQETGDQFGFLIFAPVYRNPHRGPSGNRPQDPAGFALGVFRIGDIVQGALAPLQPRGIDLQLLDMTAPAHRRLLCFRPSRLRDTTAAGQNPPPRRSIDLRYSAEIDVAGRRWRLNCTAVPEVFVSTHRSWLPWVAFAAGLLLTAGLAGQIVHLGCKNLSLEAMTSQLRAANLGLSDEVAKRRKAQERMAELALTDALTKLPNRRRLMEMIERELRRIQRYGGVLAVISINLDHLKAVHDTYGHAMADRVIAEVGGMLPTLARRVDSVGRYVGDEFVILMPQTGVEEAVTATERIAKAVADHTISDGRRSVKVTLSAGVRMVAGSDAASPEGLLDSCQEALATAKKAGRNCVRTWTPSAVPASQVSDAGGDLVKRLTRQVASLGRHAEAMSIQSIWALVQALEARDAYTRGHSENVTRYAVGIAEVMGIGAAETETLRRAAMVHDIGKIGVPDAVLRKTDPLTDDEWRTVRGHVLAGVRILKEVPLLQPEVHIVRCHHEQWDGGGYPEGITGQAIPSGARILAVADTLDAITTDRVYRRARSLNTAMKIITDESGKQFDPAVTEALAEWVRRMREVHDEELTTEHLLAAHSVSMSTA